jgi:hypothetical protein
MPVAGRPHDILEAISAIPDVELLESSGEGE